MRYLHFGTEWIQGGMRVSRPYALELAYQQEMMAPGLFLPEPRRIVQLGLGAAALTKFCYRNVPSADVVVVELSQDVIDAARGWFLLPGDDARLMVVHERRTSSRDPGSAAARSGCRSTSTTSTRAGRCTTMSTSTASVAPH